MERIRPLKQIYGDYTKDDFMVWKTLFNRQMESINKYASVDYIKSLKDIGFTADKIPDFKEVNARLQKYTGWSLYSVPCISPPAEFFQLLSEKKFTATCWLRSPAELDYIEEPDMFHDVFGHAPPLTNSDYCSFFKAMGDIAIKHINNENIITMLQRLYWFTIEFGLISENNEWKIYGAGIISSKGETQNALGHKAKKRPYNVAEIMQHAFRNDVIQEEYYVIDSFAQLKNSITQIEKEIERQLGY